MMTKSVNKKRIVQCTLVGDGLVGKTSVIMKFLKQEIQDVYTATVFDNFAGKLINQLIQFAFFLSVP